MKSENAVLYVLVPDNHPFQGHRVVVPAASGATTYNEGVIEFTSPLTLSVQAAIRDLQETLTQMKAKKA